MFKQVAFAITLFVTLGIFSFTINRFISYFRLTKPAFPVRDIGKRFGVMFEVAIGQTKIFRRPVIGFFHALTFWGFCVILIGSIEMIIDGLFRTDHVLKFMGPVYTVIIASGDVFALLVAISIIIFISRRLFFHIRRFQGIEMKPVSKMDAKIALGMILFLMVSLIGMNSAYCAGSAATGESVAGVYPVSILLVPLYAGMAPGNIGMVYETCWWSHILMIFVFTNVLPYSKHFHVFMSVPNVFLSRLEPLGKLQNMDSITREVKMIMYPDAGVPAPAPDAAVERFGIKDAEDITWKNYLDALACTECGRCTSVCPASMTGKRLSPRKIVMDVRARMKSKGPGLVRSGKDFTDNKSLLRDYITEEELWACTTCNACAMECPININQPAIIVDMRRYLVMEEASAPAELKTMFNNMENNGAPWQYSPEDRMLWADDLMISINNT